MLVVDFALFFTFNNSVFPRFALLGSGIGLSIRLFSYFYQGQNLQVMHVELAFNATGFSLFVLSILLIGLTIYAFLKKAPALITFFLSILFVFSSYLALILSIT